MAIIFGLEIDLLLESRDCIKFLLEITSKERLTPDD
jgi:hypothetical protein